MRAPRRVLESVRGETFVDPDGQPYQIPFEPGLSAEQVAELQEPLPGPLPDEIVDLLSFTRGFGTWPIEIVDFTGALQFEFPPAFPAGVPVAGDGFGNYWVVDVDPASGAWGPVFFACHDPAVIVFQAPTLAAFLDALVRLDRDRVLDARNLVDEVHDAAAMRIWRDNPGLVTVAEARASGDQALRSFAEQLDDRFEICDLRRAEPGDGFSWGRAGFRAEVRRHGTDLLFAAEAERRGLLRRMTAR